MKLIDWCKENGEFGEKILSEYTGIREDTGEHIPLESMTHGSGIKVKWKCSEGHEWSSTTNVRTSGRYGCPQCYENNRGNISSKGKLKIGENDLKTWCLNNGEYGKRVAAEWTGIRDNGTKVDFDVTTAQSNKKMLWQCIKNSDHKWYTTIQKRTLLESGCPYCAGTKVSDLNSLESWCKANNRLDLLDEYTGVDENGEYTSANKIAKSTPKKIKWQHKTENGTHEWFARVSDRTNNSSRCPICYAGNTLIYGVNDLETWCNNNKELGDILKEQWTGVTEDDEIKEMNEISSHTHTKMMWVCNCTRTWYSSPLSRLYHEIKACPKCTKEESERKRYAKVLAKSTTLKEWCLNNGEIGAKILSEFVGMDEALHDVDADKITFGSAVRVLWRHSTSKGEVHEWFTPITNRTHNFSNCPFCNNKSTSLPEQTIYRCIKQAYPDTISRGKYKGYEYDVMIPSLNTYIEYGSYYYHDGKEQKDLEKAELCKKDNIKFIAVTDTRDNNDQLWTESEIKTCIGNSKSSLMRVVACIFKIIGADPSNIDFDKAYTEAISFMQKQL